MWIFNYYTPTTSKRTNVNVGRYPEITLAQARAKMGEFRKLLAQGIDPKICEQQQERERELINNNTVLVVAEKWRAKKTGEIEPKTLNKYWRSLELHIFPLYRGFFLLWILCLHLL